VSMTWRRGEQISFHLISTPYKPSASLDDQGTSCGREYEAELIIYWCGYRLSSLGYEAGIRILNLLLLRNAQTAGAKVSILPLCIIIASTRS